MAIAATLNWVHDHLIFDYLAYSCTVISALSRSSVQLLLPVMERVSLSPKMGHSILYMQSTWVVYVISSSMQVLQVADAARTIIKTPAAIPLWGKQGLQGAFGLLCV